MAGATFKITLRDTGVMDALGRLAQSDTRLMPMALKNLGVLNAKQTQRRFVAQRDPDGKSWAPLNPVYAAGKRGPGILRGPQRRLYGSIVWQLAGSAAVAIGTNKVYGAVHQFGAVIRPRTHDALAFWMGGRYFVVASVRIPARPYLGAGSADRTEMVRLVEGIIRRDWEGR